MTLEANGVRRLPNPPKESLPSVATYKNKDTSAESSGNDVLSASTLTLCLCLLTQSWLLISVFPYSGFMAIFLIPSLNEETAGSYAGFIAAAFMVGRSLTSFAWGRCADIYGRKFVLILSLSFACLFSLLFGLVSSFESAMLCRFLLGMGNGMVGTIKTLVSELADGNEQKETKRMSIVMGMWGWGFLVSPALSGLLAEPVRQYPESALVHTFPHILSEHPFLLPNLVSMLLCITAIVLVRCFIPETLQLEERRDYKQLGKPLIMRLKSQLRAPVKEDPSTVVYGSVEDNRQHEMEPMNNDIFDLETIRDTRLSHSESCSLLSTASPQPSLRSVLEEPEKSTSAPLTMKSIWSQRNTRNHLIVYWFHSFFAISVDEAFPLFCISLQGGFGLSEGAIGKVMSASGLLFAASQYFVYSWLVDRVGLHQSIKVGAFVCFPLLLLLPMTRYLGSDTTDTSGLSWLAFSALAIILAMFRVFCMVVFSSITIATNRTVSPSHRGAMNGLSMLGGSFSKAFGPIFAGFLVSTALSSVLVTPQVGALTIFLVLGLLGFINFLFTWYFL